MLALQAIGGGLLVVAAAALLRTVPFRRRAAPRTPGDRRWRLALGGRRFAYAGAGLTGLALLLSPALPGDWRAGLLALAVADLALGLYLLLAAR